MILLILMEWVCVGGSVPACMMVLVAAYSYYNGVGGVMSGVGGSVPACMMVVYCLYCVHQFLSPTQVPLSEGVGSIILHHNL